VVYAPAEDLFHEETQADPVEQCQDMLGQVGVIEQTLNQLEAELTGRVSDVQELDNLIDQLEIGLTQRRELSQPTQDVMRKLRVQVNTLQSNLSDAVQNPSHPTTVNDPRIIAEQGRLDNVLKSAGVNPELRDPDTSNLERLENDLQEKINAKLGQLDQMIRQMQTRAIVLEHLSGELEQSNEELREERIAFRNEQSEIQSAQNLADEQQVADESEISQAPDCDQSEQSSNPETDEFGDCESVTAGTASIEDWAASDVDLLSQRPGFEFPQEQACELAAQVESSIAESPVELNEFADSESPQTDCEENDREVDFEDALSKSAEFASELDAVIDNAAAPNPHEVCDEDSVTDEWDVESSTNSTPEENDESVGSPIDKSDQSMSASSTDPAPTESLLDPLAIMRGDDWASESTDEQEVKEELAEQRTRLRHYMERFGDQTEDAEDEGSAQVAVGVSHAAEFGADGEVSNAMRSRAEAVRQLDELVREATSRAGENETIDFNHESVVSPETETVDVSETNTIDFGTAAPVDETLSELPSDDNESASSLDADQDNDESTESIPSQSNETVAGDTDATDLGEFDSTASAETEIANDEPANLSLSIDELFHNQLAVADTQDGTEEQIDESDDKQMLTEPIEPELQPSISFDDSEAQALRSRLAEMFDLPSDMKTTSTDESVDTGELAETESTELSWSNDATPDADSEQDEKPATHATFENDFEEREFQDEIEEADDLPDATSDSSETESIPSSDVSDEAGSTSTDEATTESSELEAEASSDCNATDPDSLSKYMEQLLARNRRQSESSSGTVPTQVVTPDIPKVVETSNTAESKDVPDETPQQDSVDEKEWLTAAPKHVQDRDAVRADIQALRQVANVSARSAVAVASRKQLKVQIATKTAATLMVLGFGMTGFLLNVSAVISSLVVGLGFFFAADLVLTLKRQFSFDRRNGHAASVPTEDVPTEDAATDDTPAEAHFEQA
jgi:hypothetical protein